MVPLSVLSSDPHSSRPSWRLPTLHIQWLCFHLKWNCVLFSQSIPGKPLDQIHCSFLRPHLCALCAFVSLPTPPGVKPEVCSEKGLQIIQIKNQNKWVEKNVLQNVRYFFGEWKSQGEKSQLKGRIFSHHERYNAKKGGSLGVPMFTNVPMFKWSNDC